MAKKGISIWLLSSLTFMSLLHLAEAVYVLVFNGEIRLLQLYPLINQKLELITPTAYFLTTASATFILWGITCIVSFENPVETFLNKILSDAKTQTAVEAQLIEQKGDVLDMMSETVVSNNELLAHVKDAICNVRAEVKEIKPLTESLEKIRTELSGLKKEVKKLEEKKPFANLCPACGKPLLPEFKMCPYCGESTRLLAEQVVSVKEPR